jgi:chemotaxis protein MotA
MSFVLGLAIAIGAIFFSVQNLGQSFLSYYDFVAFAMVIGGTVAVSVMLLPFDSWRDIFYAIRSVFEKPVKVRRKLLLASLDLVHKAQVSARIEAVTFPGIAGQVLKDGAELINLGFAVEKIEGILLERIRHRRLQGQKIAKTVRNLSKYPPAFGLAGTVLGLVHLMRGISEGIDPTETGVRMAIALVATLYGLLVANLVVNPVGEVQQKYVEDEGHMAEVALQAVLLAAERTPALEAQELLNSFVPEAERYREHIIVDIERDEAA